MVLTIHRKFYDKDDTLVYDAVMKVQHYNSSKNLVRETRYTQMGEIEETLTFEYAGDLLVEETLHNNQNELQERITYEYNDAGDLVLEIYHYNDGSADERHSYFPNETTQLIVVKSSDESIIAKEKFVLDTNGNTLSEQYFDGDDNLERKVEREYKDDLMVKEETFDDDVLVKSEFFSYDLHGKVIHSEMKNREGESIIRTNYSYQEDLLVEELTTTPNGSFLLKNIYDEDGKKICIENYENDQLVFRNNIKYDSQNRTLSQRIVEMSDSLNKIGVEELLHTYSDG